MSAGGATTNQLLGWLTALGLGAERAWKIYSDHRGQAKEEKAISITEGDSLFRRANEMMDRLETEAKNLRDENSGLRKRVIDMEDELAAIRRILISHGIEMPVRALG